MASNGRSRVKAIARAGTVWPKAFAIAMAFTRRLSSVHDVRYFSVNFKNLGGLVKGGALSRFYMPPLTRRDMTKREILNRLSGSQSMSGSGFLSRPGSFNTPEGRATLDPEIKRILEQLGVDSRLLADSALSMFIENGSMNKETLTQYLLKLLAADLDQAHAEEREDTALYREAEALNKLGVNTALSGMPNISGSSGDGAGTPTPSISSGSGSSAGTGLIDGIERIARIGSSIGSLFTGAQSATAAISSLFGVSGSLSQQAISAALGDIPGIVDDFSASDLSNEELSQKVLDTIFGDPVTGEGGRLAGYSRKQRLRAYDAASRYLKDFLSGDKYATSKNVSAGALADSRRSRRVSEHGDAVDAVSGVYDMQGRLFQAQVRSARQLARAQIKLQRTTAELEQMKVDYETKYQSNLDADLAAMAENKENQARVDKANAQSTIAGLEVDAQRAQNRSLELSNEQKEYLIEVQKKEGEVRKIQADCDGIVANAQYEMLDAMTKSDRVTYETGPNRRAYEKNPHYRAARKQDSYRAMKKALGGSSSKLKLNVPGIGGLELGM